MILMYYVMALFLHALLLNYFRYPILYYLFLFTKVYDALDVIIGFLRFGRQLIQIALHPHCITAQAGVSKLYTD